MVAPTVVLDPVRVRLGDSPESGTYRVRNRKFLRSPPLVAYRIFAPAEGAMLLPRVPLFFFKKKGMYRVGDNHL